MGVSFKVARIGTRYSRVPLMVTSHVDEKDSENDSQPINNQDEAADHGNVLSKVSREPSVPEDIEVSFVLNLFPNGFWLGCANEVLTCVPKQLLPYVREADKLFTAIEHGWFPGDVFDGMPCKYVNGAILCKIRDYRNCLVQKTGTISVEPSPVVHKVHLQMCMENVVKSISSISDDSWTYEDLLEAESRILMTLQPDLNLNPNPSLNQFCGRKTKKLNLGISCDRKRRKLIDAPRVQQAFGNSHQATHNTGIVGNQISELHNYPVDQGRGRPYFQQKVSSTISNPKENTDVLQTNSQSIFLAINSVPKEAWPLLSLGISCDRKKRKLIDAPQVQQAFGNSHQATHSTGIVGNQIPELQCSPVDQGRGRPYSQQKVSSTISNPKENTDVLQTNSQPIFSAIISVPKEVEPWVNCDTSKYVTQVPVGPIVRKSKDEPMEFSPQLPTGRQVEKNLKLPKSALKRFCVKGDFSPSTNYSQLANPDGIPKIKQEMPESHLSRFQKHQHHLSSLLKESPLPNAHGNMSNNPVGQNSKNQVVDQKKKRTRKVVANSTDTNHSVPRKVSISGQRKKISHRKNSITKTVTSNVTVTNTSNIEPVNIPSPLNLGVEDELRRLLKIEEVSARFRLHEKKCTMECKLPKMRFPRPPLLDCNFFSVTEHGNLNDPTTERTSLSQCFVDKTLSVSKKRAITFARPSCTQKDRENGDPSFNSVGQVKMVMVEKLYDGTVEASVLYENELEPNIAGFTIQQAFPGTLSADLFTAQFSSLMVREGFFIASDRIDPVMLNASGSSTFQQHIGNGDDTLTAGPPQMPSSNLYQMLSHSTPNLMPGSMVARDNGQLPPSHSRFFQGHESNLYDSLFVSTTAGGPMNHPQWQEILNNKRAFLRFQMLQRMSQQDKIMKRKHSYAPTRDGGSPGAGHQNFGLGNVFGHGDRLTVPQREQLPWIDNVGAQFNDFESKTPGFFGNNYQLPNIIHADRQTKVLSRLRSVQSQGNSFPLQRIQSSPTITNQQHQQLQIVPLSLMQQDDRSFLMSPEPLSFRSTSQQMINRNAMVKPGSSELSPSYNTSS